MKRNIVPVLLCAAALSGCARTKPEYTWRNVAIGGGGYVTGIVFSKAEENLIYARTDIGGAYRWMEEEGRWVAITDHFGAEEWNLIGIESIAADPVEAGRVYALCGMYMDNKGAILSSSDYGETWTQTELPFGCGANEEGRGAGERMMVNPKKHSEIYTGTRNAGLWRSEDFGKTWQEVTSFPVKGDYMQQSTSIGILWVQFDPVSEDVYVGVAETNGSCIYRSSDSGETWEALPANLPGMYPLHADFAADGTLYLTYANSAGPNSGANENRGAVCKLSGSTFTDITPGTEDGRYGAFGGISVDANDPETVIVSTLFYWDDHGDSLYRTTDGGKTWTSLFNARTGEKHYTMEVSQANWLNWGRPEAKTGWWMTDVKLNPFNSDEAMYGTGAAVFRTQNLTSPGTEPVVISFAANGMEETAVYRVVSPEYEEGEPQLYSIMGDLTGFSHLDVETIPDDAHFMGSTSGGDPTGLDAASQKANTAVYAIDNDKQPLWLTTNGGADWTMIEPPAQTAGGTVAMNANGTAFLWSNPGNADVYRYSLTEGNWSEVEGLGINAKITADSVNPDWFYAVSNGLFYRSSDGGQTFTKTGQLVADSTTVHSVVRQEGNVWLCSGTLLLYSEDFGESFSVIKDMDFRAIGFGAPEQEGGYPVIYALGSAGEQGEGLYRSTDKGQSWQRINDEQHRFGMFGDSITGDSRVSGRVYVTTNGRGIVMGDITK